MGGGSAAASKRMSSASKGPIKHPTENPLVSFQAAQLHLKLPRRMTVRLTDIGRLALTDIGTLFFTIFLSLAIGFGTTYFSHDNPPHSLLAEFLGWAALAVVTLLVILYLRYKMYTEPTETVSYQLDEGAPLRQAAANAPSPPPKPLLRLARKTVTSSD